MERHADLVRRPLGGVTLRGHFGRVLVSRQSTTWTAVLFGAPRSRLCVFQDRQERSPWWLATSVQNGRRAKIVVYYEWRSLCTRAMPLHISQPKPVHISQPKPVSQPKRNRINNKMIRGQEPQIVAEVREQSREWNDTQPCVSTFDHETSAHRIHIVIVVSRGLCVVEYTHVYFKGLSR